MDECVAWPETPRELNTRDVRLPYYFRLLVSNQKFTNEEIGRIVRCIVMDTDFFILPTIESEVFFIRKQITRKEKSRVRVSAYRNRKKEDDGSGQDAAEGVTVTHEVENGDFCDHDPHSTTKKTSPILIEKTPPIVPLEKTSPSLLEKTPNYSAGTTRREKVRDALQQDLFSTLQGVEDRRVDKTSPETCLKRPLTASEGSGRIVDTPEAASAPRAVKTASDERADLAWIPAKFAIFWQNYPKKVAKANAEKAFSKIIRVQHDVESFMKTTLQSLNWWKQQKTWLKEDGKFIPYPASWLNAGHWDDVKENEISSNFAGAEYLNTSQESDDDLIKRMQGG